MKRKIIWLILSSVMVAALLLASCAPAIIEPEEVAPSPEEEEEVVTEEEVAPSPAGPIRGGMINYAIKEPSYGFDPLYTGAHLCATLMLTHECLMVGDWSKGPAGTGETTFQSGIFLPPYEIGCLAESWEIPDDETIIYHIRKGVHWHDKPPVNGREMTAYDVVYNLQREFFSTLPWSKGIAFTEENISSATAIDKWTVVVKCPSVASQGSQFPVIGEIVRILPPEAGGELPGDFRHWEGSIGTGPFILVDQVPASSVTFVRNPNYWMKDPVHPDNTLPYADGVNMLVIVDSSTRLAALRTGKIDAYSGLLWEDRDSLAKTNPELLWAGGLGMTNIIGMRLDKPELPFHDIRVRRALAMGLNRRAIAEDYYGGNAELFAYPVQPIPAYKDMFTPLEELSESIQELYKYDPEKARQLLAEAGYPDGFKTEIVCNKNQADMLSIVKADWADIGVDLDIQVRDFGTYRGMAMAHGHSQMYIGGMGPIEKLRPFNKGSETNTSMILDPYLVDIYASKMQPKLTDWDWVSRVVKEDVAAYALEQCWYVDLPATKTYSFWQPWLKGYHGESSVGQMNSGNWMAYVWLDQELKTKELGR